MDVKKVICGLACVALVSSQGVNAAALTDGAFAGANVLDPTAGIGGAAISGHTNGLTNVTTNGTNATLNFNNDTRIDWTNLNVGSNQSLNFLNGNNVVLNNVLNNMSTFAGKVSGQQGAIIISNPNGILLQGGKFETAGALTLTTKNLLNASTFDKDGKIKVDIDNAKYNSNEYHIISICKNGETKSEINAGDFNIISKGINIDGANITADNNVTFTTSDGANFLAQSAKGNIDNVKFVSSNTMQIADAAIKTKNGEIKFQTLDRGSIFVQDSNINGRLTISSPNHSVIIKDSNVKADQIRINAKYKVAIEGSNIEVDKFSNDNTVGGLIVEATDNDSYVQIGWTNLTGNDSYYNRLDGSATTNYSNTIIGDMLLSSKNRVSVNHSIINGDITSVGKQTYYTDNNIVGNTKFVALEKAQIDKCNIVGNVDMSTSKADNYFCIYSSNIKGNVNLNSASAVKIQTSPNANKGNAIINTELPENKIMGDLTITAKGNINVTDYQLKNIDTTTNGKVALKNVEFITEPVIVAPVEEPKSELVITQNIINNKEIKKDALPINSISETNVNVISNNDADLNSDNLDFNPIAFAANDLNNDDKNSNTIIYQNAQNIVTIK